MCHVPDVYLGRVVLHTPDQLFFTLDSGGSVTLDCRADGNPLPDIVWLRNGGVVVSSLTGNKFEVVSSTLPSNDGETAVSMLTVNDLSSQDSGNYTCRASNGVDSVFLPLSYSLTVLPSPPPNFCSPNPCLNGGRCISGSFFFQCQCQAEFTGIICDIGKCFSCGSSSVIIFH